MSFLESQELAFIGILTLLVAISYLLLSLLYTFYKTRDYAMLQQTLQQSIEQGQDLKESVISTLSDALAQQQEANSRKNSLALIGFGLGLIIISALSAELAGLLSGIGIISLFIGALHLFWGIRRQKKS